MKYNLYKAMQKPEIQIYVSKEYLFTPALIKMKLFDAENIQCVLTGKRKQMERH